ncbi:MAG: kinase 1 [Thermoplasmata archaeon]|jgi:RIO kinase 1|nr:kinase 1 [Thermoplasmata archaeon]
MPRHEARERFAPDDDEEEDERITRPAPAEEVPDLSDLPEDWQEVVLRSLEARKTESVKREDEDRKTLDEVFDRSTLLVLYKMISNGFLETIDYPVSTGKEANVFHATTPQGGSLAVKIFRTNTATFRSFMTYIAGDPRFGNVRPNRRDIVYVWAQKEYKNLQRYVEAGVRVPNPIAWRQNVLLMEFVGTNGAPAPRLKDAPYDDPKALYQTLIGQYRLGSEQGGLVHGDFSEFNILHPEGGEPIVIDVAQAVLSSHPMARDLLVRDAKNISTYFRKQGLKVTPEETLKAIAPPARAAVPIDKPPREEEADEEEE